MLVPLRLSALKCRIFIKWAGFVVGENVEHDYLLFCRVHSVFKKRLPGILFKVRIKTMLSIIGCLNTSETARRAHHQYKSIHHLFSLKSQKHTQWRSGKWQIKTGNGKWNPSAGDDNDLALRTERTNTPESFENTSLTENRLGRFKTPL